MTLQPRPQWTFSAGVRKWPSYWFARRDPTAHRSYAPRLITFDVTGTVADIDGVSHVERICRLSPLPADQVRRVLYEQLKLKTLPRRAALTPELVRKTCRGLQINTRDFPFGTVPLAPYRLRPGAPRAVAAAAAVLPVALLTNLSVFADPCLRPVSDGLHPHLRAVHASWAMRAAKPDRRAFLIAAAYHDLAPTQVIHVGDSWREDVVPMLALGGRAVWLNPDREPVPGPEPVPRDSLLVAATLAEAVDQAIARWVR